LIDVGTWKLVSAIVDSKLSTRHHKVSPTEFVLERCLFWKILK
jgi:hypothetical protein